MEVNKLPQRFYDRVLKEGLFHIAAIEAFWQDKQSYREQHLPTQSGFRRNSYLSDGISLFRHCKRGGQVYRDN